MSAPAGWLSTPVDGLLEQHSEEVRDYLTWADRLVRRGLICNTLGNIAVVIDDERLPNGRGILTKPRGISLEEMTIDQLVITDTTSPKLFHGRTPPSGGHLLNQRLLSLNEAAGIRAAIHTHPDILIGLMSQLDPGEFDFISVDTAIVLGQPPKVFDYGVNPESDVNLISETDLRATCLLMPNHGLTTLGRSIGEAFHRHTSMLAEANRVLVAMLVAGARGRAVRYTPESDTSQLYALGAGFLYGAR